MTVIEIHTHDGKVIEENVEVYDAKEVEARLNTQEPNKTMVSFGTTVLSRHTIKMIRPKVVMPVEEEPAV